ncbi:MAG TPA: hypothetical protein VFM46_18550, partial [Pseudomonadales bacterium]|nr:hypothetical protein [Pseudomonadales bacterium]
MAYSIHSSMPRRAIRIAKGISAVLLLAALAACSNGADSLRGDIPQKGVAATVQVDLPQTGQKAQIAATVYKDGVAQPLVGGDVWQARTDQSLVTLKGVSNLSG